MKLFDRLGGRAEISLSPQAGLVLAAISMVAIDGDVDDDELAIIRRLDGSGRTEAWDMAVKLWKTRPLDECVSLVARALDQQQRLATMANLIDIAMADGLLEGAERQLLEQYTSAFELAESDIEPIVAVVALKNNKSIFR